MQKSAGELCRVHICTFDPDAGHRRGIDINRSGIDMYRSMSVDIFLGDEYQLEILGKRSSFRWIHLPMNNMAWVERCVEKCSRRSSMGGWRTSIRPALSGIFKTPLHSRHMEPSFAEAVDDQVPQYSIYIPYLNWDKYTNFKRLTEVYARLQSGKALTPLHSHLSTRQLIECKTAEFLNHDSEGRSLHPRRTLDQFYYSSLSNTTSRDRGQTVSKWTGPEVGVDGRASAVDDSYMLIVDQLWCWVIDEQTVLSCFPADDVQFEGIRDLYTTISDSANDLGGPWDLLFHIVRHAITHLHTQSNRDIVDWIEIYKWATSQKTAYAATCFQEFREDKNRGAALDDTREMALAIEVADIIDELKMIDSLLKQQRNVLSTCEHVSQQRTESHPEYCILALTHLRSTLINVQEIKDEAETTYKQILDLLDLKSKTATLAEARSTTKQGQAVMLFTIVTIIFLPLSFFTSYFGQNVSEITGDDANPTSWELWRVGTPITVAVICVALLIAYRIMYPDSKLWFWQKRKSSYRTEPTAAEGDIEMGSRQ